MPRLTALTRHPWVRRIGIGLAVLVVGLYLLFWGLFFNPLEGAYRGELAQLAPEKSIFALHVRDLAGRWRALADGPGFRIYEESARTKRFLESELYSEMGGGSFDQALAMLDRTEAQLGFDVATEDNVMEVLGREFLVFAAPGKAGSIGLCLVARVPFRVKVLEAAFERFGSGAVPEGGFEERFRGVGLPMHGAYVGRVRDCVVVSTDPYVFDDTMDRAAGSASGTLHALGWQGVDEGDWGDPALYVDFPSFHRSEFQRLIEQATQGHVGRLLADTYRDLFPPEATGRIKGTVFLPREDPTRLGVEVVGELNPARLGPGRRRVVEGKPRPFVIEKVLPDSAVLVTMRRADCGEYLDRFFGELGEGFQRTWTEFRRQTGETLGRPRFYEDEFLPNLGDEVGFMLSKVDYAAGAEPGQPPPADRFPAMSLLFAVRDPEAVRPLLEVGMRMHHDLWNVARGSVVERRAAGGALAFDWTQNPVQAEASIGRTMRPAVALVGNVLVFTSHRSAIDDVARVAAGESAALSTSERYVRAVDGGALAADLLLYADLQNLLDVAGGVAGYIADQNVLAWRLSAAGQAYLQQFSEGDAGHVLAQREREEFARILRDIEACRLFEFVAVRAFFEPRRVESEFRLGLAPGGRAR